MKNFVCAALVLLGASSLKAVTVDYDLVSVVGNQWKYSYTVFNDSSSTPISDLLIYFPSDSLPLEEGEKYNLLSVTATTLDWTGTAVQASAVDLGAYAEWAGGSIPLGGSATGFEVVFTYDGTERLGSQYFQAYEVDAGNYTFLDDGQTSRPGTTVPESATAMTYAFIALAVLGGAKRFTAVRA